MNNTLLIGNGLDQALYKNAKKWEEILSSDEDLRLSINNYTFLYETNLLRKIKCDNTYDDNKYKGEILNRLLQSLDEGNKRSGVESIEKLVEYSRIKHIDNILSTNYDHVVENGLTNCGYTLSQKNSSEKIYSVRRKRVYGNNNHTICVWKIHGDQENIPSICLGYDQYCGYLSKIQDYVKGTYTPSKGEGCHIKIEDKIKNKTFDGLSWIELFFNSNIYIVGFSLDSSEIDLWWLLQRRARMIKNGVKIKNKIVYLYSEYDQASDEKIKKEKDPNKKSKMIDDNKKLDDKIFLLNELDVECRKIEVNNTFFTSVFSEIK